MLLVKIGGRYLDLAGCSARWDTDSIVLYLANGQVVTLTGAEASALKTYLDGQATAIA